MIFIDGDEVKVNLEIEKYFFGTFSGADGGENLPNYKKFFKKKSGVILEHDYSSKLKRNSYFVEFDKDENKRYWFLAEELILI